MSKIVISLMIFLSLLHSDIYKRGERVFASVCDSTKLKALSYKDRDDLIKQISSKNLCTNLNSKNLNALVAYMQTTNDHKTQSKIDIPKKAKCPVCGMWVAKYPKWVASIEQNGEKLYFDGVKDMMKFYFNPKRFHHQKLDISEILVTDYYTLKPIVAQKAYYVLGSNIYGPMGEELIPFQNKKDAKAFKLDHDGKTILTFDKIEEKFLY